MVKKVKERKSKQQRFREIEHVLQSAGVCGMRVSSVAHHAGIAKSYAHKLLTEMVDAGLIERHIQYEDSDKFYVNYCYYQLPLFDQIGINTDYDGLNGECTMCGKDFSGSADGMCSSCRQVWNG